MEYVKSENFREKLSICTFDMDNVPADRNTNQKKVRRLLTDPAYATDIVCLQSVSESMRELVLRIALDNRYKVTWIRESLRYENYTYVPSYAVIILRKKSFLVDRYDTIPHDDPLDTSFLSQMFIDTRRTFEGRDSIRYGLQTLWADIDIGSRVIRIFCIHLPFVATSQTRMQHLRAILDKRSKRHDILLGNFNIYETRTAGIVKSVIEGSSRHAAAPHSERDEMERLFREHELSNTLRGFDTVDRLFGRNQPDHILVPNYHLPEKWRVSPLDKRCFGIGEQIGSRHFPAIITIQFNRFYQVSADEQMSW